MIMLMMLIVMVIIFQLGTSAYKRQRGASVGPMEKKHDIVGREVLGLRAQGGIEDEFKLLHRLELRQGKLLWVPEVQVCAEEVEDGTDRPFWVPESAWCLRGRGFTEAPHASPKEALQIGMHEPLPPELVCCLALVCNEDLAQRSVVDGVQPAGTGILLMSS